jgi:hypothetical protein
MADGRRVGPQRVVPPVTLWPSSELDAARVRAWHSTKRLARRFQRARAEVKALAEAQSLRSAALTVVRARRKIPHNRPPDRPCFLHGERCPILGRSSCNPGFRHRIATPTLVSGIASLPDGLSTTQGLHASDAARVFREHCDPDTYSSQIRPKSPRAYREQSHYSQTLLVQ